MRKNFYCFSEEERNEILDVVRSSMSFEGSGDGSYYDGSHDDFICFDGAQNASFISEASAVYRQFVFTISNNTTSPQKILLMPDYKWSPAYNDFVPAILSVSVPATSIDGTKPDAAVACTVSGMVSRGYLMDGTSYAQGVTISTSATDILTCSGSPSTIQDFYSFIKSNPTNLLGMKIADNSSDSTQIAQPLQIVPRSPFKTLQSTPLYPSTQLTQDSFQQNVCLFNTNGIVLSDQTAIEYTIAPKLASGPRVVNITMICGAVLNTAKALENKTSKAVNNAATLLQKVNAGIQI